MKKHKISWASIILILLFLFLLIGCSSQWKQSIPQGEIIFMDDATDSYHLTTGIVDLQTNEYNALLLTEKFAKPVWTKDGTLLLGLSGSFQAGGYWGHPAYWDVQQGQYKICEKELPFFGQIQSSNNPENRYEVILHNTLSIVVFDLSTCKEIKLLVDFSNGRNDKFLAGFSYSSEKDLLLYGLVYQTMPQPNHRVREYRLILFDLKTGQEIQLAEGINPAWSPDSSRFAYIGLDGLYVYHLEDKTTTNLVNQPFFSPWNSGSPWGLVTEPSWSPDGAWILYHSCPLNVVFSAKDCAIYKIPSGGGVPQMVIDHGLYPKWRP